MFAKFAVDLEFFGVSLVEHLVVAAAVGFGDQGAEFALAAFEVTMLEGVERVFDLLGQRIGVGGARRVVVVLEGAGEKDATVLVGRGVERVGRRGGVGESFEERGGGEARRTTRDAGESWSAARMRAGSCSGRTRARRRMRSVSLAGSCGVGADAFDALGGGLFELLAEDGGVDAELLRGVGGELVALDAVGHAADVRQEEVEGFDLGVGGARRGTAGGRGR